MGNLGGGEILVILLVALIVLGPTKLPPAVRQVGKVVGEIRRIGQGFQAELREAAKPLTDATADLKAADKSLRETTQKPLKEMTDTLKAADPRKVIDPPPDPKDKDKDTAASGKSGDASGTAAAGAAAAGPVSWGTAEARVSPPPAAGGEDTGTTADAVEPASDPGSDAVEPASDPGSDAVEPDPDPGAAGSEPAAEPEAEPKTDGTAD
ncbi:MAG: twin-arginine translocase subunit TatB [Acidimicrobiaceae bacterium]|nr:twin-arginine translocase subunit TatB [Acidimicrobiaceae bacterium]MYB87412.1 twin-arginine translocase subunit TatB [Acidimicrobiaceae bacterium]